VLHWHGDTFDLPAGSPATSTSIKTRVSPWEEMGWHYSFIQRSLLWERWFIGHACEIGVTPGVSVAQLRQEAAHYIERLEAQAAKFWHAWLEKLEA